MHAAEEVNIGGKIFRADPHAKEFLSSPVAVVCWWQFLVIPHLRKYGVDACMQALEYPPADSVTAKDTAWLLGRMNRSSSARTPDGKQSGGEGVGGEAVEREGTAELSLSARIVRETHAATESRYLTVADVNRLAVRSNPGCVPRRGGEALVRKLRSDWLREAIAEYPHVIRVVPSASGAGQRGHRFERRAVDLGGFEKCVAGHGGAEAFGGWCDWAWPASRTGAWMDPVEPRASLPDGDQWQLSCLVNLTALEAYCAERKDRRQAQLEAFVRWCKNPGAAEQVSEDGGLWRVSLKGRQKAIAGKSMGRAFFAYTALPYLTREARGHVQRVTVW